MATNGKHVYNNGIINRLFKDDDEIPAGFSRGGLPHSEKQNREHSEALKKKYASGEIQPWNKGLKGFVPWNKGKKGVQTWSPESRKKLSESIKGKKKPVGFGEKISEKMRGKHLSEETKEKIAAHYRGKPIPHEKLEERNKKQFETKNKNGTFNSSKPELIYQTIFEKNFQTYAQYYDESLYPYTCDFYLKDLEIFVECNFFRSHGPHPFGTDLNADTTLVNQWVSRQSTYKTASGKIKKNSYFTYEKVFTRMDPEKLQTALTNKIKYLLIYPKELYFYACGELKYHNKGFDFMYNTEWVECTLQKLAAINGWTVVADADSGLNKLYKADGSEVSGDELKVGAENLIKYYYTQQWDGQLPGTMLSGSTDILLGIGD